MALTVQVAGVSPGVFSGLEDQDAGVPGLRPPLPRYGVGEVGPPGDHQRAPVDADEGAPESRGAGQGRQLAPRQAVRRGRLLGMGRTQEAE